MGISFEVLQKATLSLFLYIKGNTENLDVMLNATTPFFNAREIAHMVDVKLLYQNSLKIKYYFSLLATMIGIYRVVKGFDIESFKKSFQCVVIGIGTFLATIGILLVINFDAFWLQFHYLFFDNDLFLLNPVTDRLIQMVPSEFFFSLCIHIVIATFVVILGIVWLLFKRTFNIQKNTLNVVLYEPEIPQNTGNIMRTCVASKVKLHIIEPTGFEISDKTLKRAGMDYVKDLEYIIYPNFEAFCNQEKGQYIFITRYGKKAPSTCKFAFIPKNIYLIFGKESTGIPKEILQNHLKHCYRLPMAETARSLNLSNCVAIVVYEVLRQLNYLSLSKTEKIKGEDYLEK